MEILKPISIGPMTLKNRFIMAPMGPELGDFNQETIAYYARRAQGGASMIVTNVLATDAIDGPSPSSLLNDTSKEGFRQLVEECHKYDCKVCLQIMPGVGLGGMGEGRTQPAGVSSLPLYPGAEATFAELSLEEISFIQLEVFKTVELAKATGADAVEIHAYGGYLTDRFMTKKWNTRHDKYGGSFENRMRFLDELITGIQTILGTQMPLILKYTPSHHLPEEFGYRGLEEGKRIAKWLIEKNVHAIHVDVGCHDNWDLAMPPIYQQEMAPQIDVARQIKEIVDVPIISNGRLGDIGKAETAVANHWLDIAAVGRQFLADPDFVNKLIENQPSKIRYCIYCNEGCIKSVTEGKAISCAVNPMAGRETKNKLLLTREKKKVLVIGAGPGGCSAAISASQAGHEVTLWEKEDYLGGNFFSACQPPFKRDGNKLLEYYRQALIDEDIQTKFNYEATREKVKRFQPDEIIYAAGGLATKPPIPGVTLGHVATATDVLRNRALVGEHVIVIGGGLVGCETALTLVSQGKSVTIIEMADKLLPEPLFIQNLMRLTALLEKSSIKQIVGATVKNIGIETVTVSTNTVEEELMCDTVVLATGFTPNQTLYNELVTEGFNVTNIGDSVAVRKVFDTVHEGYDAVAALS